MGVEVTIQLRILRGINLPKTDMLSEIDPYIKFSYKGVLLQTVAVDNNKDPEWNEDFFIECLEEEDGTLVGAVRLDLWDQEEIGGDQYCGWAVLDLTQYTAHQLTGEELVLKITYCADKRAKYQKQGRESALVVAVVGRMRSFRTFANATAGIPGIKAVPATRSLFAEVPTFGDKVMVGICWANRQVEFMLCSTRPPSTVLLSLEYECGPACAGTWHRAQESTTVRRTLHARGLAGLIPGHKVYEQLSTSHLQLNDHFDKVVLTACARKKLGGFNVGQTLADSGWKGPDTAFRSAAKSLAKRGCSVDKEWRCIYVQVDDLAVPELMLMLDYSAGDSPSLKLCILAVHANEGRGFDFAVPSEGEVLINSEVFVEPLEILGATLAIARTLELPAPLLGDVLNDTEVVIYELSKPQSWTMAELVMPRGRMAGRQVAPPPPSKVLTSRATGVGRQVRKMFSRLARLVGLRASKSPKLEDPPGTSGRRQRDDEASGGKSSYEDDEGDEEDDGGRSGRHSGRRSGGGNGTTPRSRGQDRGEGGKGGGGYGQGGGSSRRDGGGSQAATSSNGRHSAGGTPAEGGSSSGRRASTGAASWPRKDGGGKSTAAAAAAAARRPSSARQSSSGAETGGGRGRGLGPAPQVVRRTVSNVSRSSAASQALSNGSSGVGAAAVPPSRHPPSAALPKSSPAARLNARNGGAFDSPGSSGAEGRGGSGSRAGSGGSKPGEKELTSKTSSKLKAVGNVSAKSKSSGDKGGGGGGGSGRAGDGGGGTGGGRTKVGGGAGAETGSSLSVKAGKPRGTHLNAGAGSVFARKASTPRAKSAHPEDDDDEDD